MRLPSSRSSARLQHLPKMLMGPQRRFAGGARSIPPRQMRAENHFSAIFFLPFSLAASTTLPMIQNNYLYDIVLPVSHGVVVPPQWSGFLAAVKHTAMINLSYFIGWNPFFPRNSPRWVSWKNRNALLAGAIVGVRCPHRMALDVATHRNLTDWKMAAGHVKIYFPSVPQCVKRLVD